MLARKLNWHYTQATGCATARVGTNMRRPHQERVIMDIQVSYEHSLAAAPDNFIVNVPSQLVKDVPANIPRTLLPEYVANLIIERSPLIGRIRNLKIL
jgi:hypothetical protein